MREADLNDCSGTRFIMRKKPPGKIISAVAHQVDREFRVLEALGSVKGFPVPRVYCLCNDTSVVGTAFYVREQIPNFRGYAMLTLLTACS